MTPTHSAPLERGDWTYHPSIDISLRWSERPLVFCVFGSLKA